MAQNLISMNMKNPKVVLTTGSRFSFFIVLLLSSLVVTFSQTLRIEKENINETTSLKTGDRRITTSLIKPGTEMFVLYRVVNDAKQPVSLLTRTIKFGRRNGMELVTVEQRYESSSGVNTDISVLNRRTLDPISYNFQSADDTESFEFTGTEVHGTIRANRGGKIQSVTVPIKAPVFNAVVLDELIRSIPLKDRLKYSFRTYIPGKQFFNITVNVIGSEVLQTVGSSVDTWVIVLEGTAVPTKMWVAKKTRQVIQKKSDLPNGDSFWFVRLYG